LALELGAWRLALQREAPYVLAGPAGSRPIFIRFSAQVGVMPSAHVALGMTPQFFLCVMLYRYSPVLCYRDFLSAAGMSTCALRSTMQAQTQPQKHTTQACRVLPSRHSSEGPLPVLYHNAGIMHTPRKKWHNAGAGDGAAASLTPPTHDRGRLATHTQAWMLLVTSLTSEM
jgi:hypothetical protein